MVARSAPWPSSPAPSARREAAGGLDRSARPSNWAAMPRMDTCDACQHRRIRYRRVNAERLKAAKNVRGAWKPAPLLRCIGCGGEGKRGADFSYRFLLHTRPMILFTGAGRPVSGMYFAQAQCGIWQCPRPRRRDCFHWWCGPAWWQVSQNGMVIRSAATARASRQNL